METNNILYYTDGHQVTITDNGIKVKKTLYRFKAITRHGLSVISPPRIPSVVLIALGAVLFMAGTLNLIPVALNTQVVIAGFSILVLSLFMGGGVLLVLAGILVMLRQREKYAVHITTDER